MISKADVYPSLKQMESILPFFNLFCWATLLVLSKQTSLGIWYRTSASHFQKIFLCIFNLTVTTCSLLPFGTFALASLTLAVLTSPSVSVICKTILSITIYAGVLALFSLIVASPIYFLSAKRNLISSAK
jgi:hypothetical protein